MRAIWGSSDREAGFTLVELLAVITVTGILLTLGASAIRHYTKVRSVQSAQDDLVSQIKEAQARAMSESHPFVYGVRLKPGAAAGASSSWGVVRYDYGAGTCTQLSTRSFSQGVYVSAADFADVSPATETCRTQVAGAAGDEFVFLFARGSATAGTATVRADGVAGTRSVQVDGITGRVSRL
jgi:prepilin-type N-terminal cleavage/methylation domain-containing protein